MMLGNDHSERLRQSFADQFEADGKDIFYRRSMKGAPVRVTEAEREAFVSAYNRRLRYAMWPIPFVTVLLIGMLVWFAPDTHGTTGQWIMWPGICLAIAPSLVIMRWAWTAPVRELKLRTPSGPARGRDEVRRIAFSRMSYQQFGVAAVGIVLLVLKVSAHQDVLHGWGRLWLVAAGGLIALTCLQAVRKWKHERT
ncbi:hypothetical protein [Novosphingobium terrae]|uniref:hypothetical protein n=1 Tax=Novosphingobium terrae TaxID=2726189 RepID=UPI00197D17C2|nr:hypothetical protein [Novosphingobium terrae]